jgi:acyl carrier protein
MALKDALVHYIQENMAAGTAIDESTPLIDRGIIDSMGLMQVIMFIEEKTGIRIPDDEVLPDNFQTVGSIEALVDRLGKSRSGGR